METMTRRTSKIDRTTGVSASTPAVRRTETAPDRSVRSSQARATPAPAMRCNPVRALVPRDAATAALWAVFPGLLGSAFASFAAGWAILGIGLLFAHQAALLAMAARGDKQDIRWGIGEWSLIGVGAAMTVAITDPMVLLWLLLPVAPAALIYVAGRDRLLPCSDSLMRLFSIVTLGAVLLQLVSSEPSSAATVALLGGSILFLAALERLAVVTHPASDRSPCGTTPAEALHR